MSADVIPRPPVATPRALTILPWLLFALTVILGAIAVSFLLVNQAGAGREQLPGLYGDMLNLFHAINIGAVGAVITARRRRNPIGWLMLGVALIQVAEVVFTGYSDYALITQPGALPVAIFFAWLAQWASTPPFAALLLGILLYPTGHLLSPRWRIVAWAGILGVAALLLSGALSSELYVGNGNPPLTLANPIGVIDAKNIGQPILLPLLYALILVMVFASLISLIIRFRRVQGDERQQLKWVTYAAALAVVTEAAANLIFGPWAQAAQSIAFLMLPLAIGVAILKYRLYEIDLLINRTLVYVPLTAILAGIFAATITLSQKLFVALTGTSSDAATVLTTLFVVAAFTPIKDRLQRVVDKRFEEASDPTRKLKTFGDQMRAVLQVIDVEQMTHRVLEEAVLAFDAQGGAILRDTDGAKPVQIFGQWNGNAQVTVSLQYPKDGARLGTLALGARRNGAEYTAQDHATLQQIADLAARAIALDARSNGVRQ